MAKVLSGAIGTMAAAGACALALAGPALANDKFKVTGAECELYWLWKRTPVLHYDIADDRRADYEVTPDADYFRQAAARTAEFCDRTSAKPWIPGNPPRKIRGIWFQSNDGSFKILYDLDSGDIDRSVGVVNQTGDQHAAKLRAEAQHQAELEEVKTREARAEEMRRAQAEAARAREAHERETKAAEAQAARDKVAAEAAREALFFSRKDLQLARLGTEVTLPSFTDLDAIRANPFHYRKLGLAIVQTRFNKMITDKLAMFGGVLAPLVVHIEDVDRFTRTGEIVLLAFKVIERGEVDRSYGSIPEIVTSVLKAEPLYGDYVGAYSCPGDDCRRIFDVSPPT